MLVSFESDNKMFLKSFTMQEEMIRRFDEVLASKVSKITMFDESAAIEEKVTVKFNELYKLSQVIDSHIKEVDLKLEDTRLVMKGEMDAMATKLSRQIS